MQSRHAETKDGNRTNTSIPRMEKKFHVHVDASTIALGAIMVHLGAGELDYPIAFASRKLSE
jgi:hypothetical protein